MMKYSILQTYNPIKSFNVMDVLWEKSGIKGWVVSEEAASFKVDPEESGIYEKPCTK